MKKFNKLFIAITFIFIFMISLSINTFAYENGFTLNDNGTLTSKNLFNYDLQYNNIVNGVSITSKNESIILNGISTSGTYLLVGTYTLESGTYSYSNYILSGSITNNEYFIKFGLRNSSVNVNLDWNGSFTIVEETVFDIVIWWNDANYSFNNLELGYMLNTGNEYLNYFPYGDYIDINKYNELNSGFNNLGFLYYLDYWNSRFTDDMYNIDTYVNGSTLNLYDMASYNNTNYSSNTIYLYFNTANNKLLVGNLNFIFSGYTNCQVEIQNQNGDYFIFQATENLVVNQDYIITNDSNNYSWEYIEEIHFICNSPDDLSTINFNVEYTIGYNNGYNSGYTYGDSSGYNKGYKDGSEESYNNGYSIGYNNGVSSANENSLYNMILAVVDAPIHIFKGIFDFNVLGINLTNFVLSLMSILIVVWLLKFFL